MTTTNKNFKVKTGLQVANDLVVGGALTVTSTTLDAHIANKQYVDTVISNLMSASDSQPASVTGRLWLDTISGKLHLFDGTNWIPMANLADTQVLADHIHDTSIDGDGQISTMFVTAGAAASTAYYLVEAGSPSTSSWTETWSGGVVTDNFN